MDILAKARRLEFTLGRSLDDAARRMAQPGARQPLEIAHAIVDAVAGRLEPAGRGTYVFPFNRINALVIAAGHEDQSRFEAVFAGTPSLQSRILDRLQQVHGAPADLQVTTRFVSGREPHWIEPDFHLEFERVTGAAAVQERVEDTAIAERVKLTIASGTAEKPAYALALDRINIGRCGEVRDHQHRLIRTNHVAFVDGEGSANHTVSRRHAHIDHDAASGAYRLCDDGSAHGTSLVRNGKTIPVPSGSRGIRLQSGDEIVLGEARVRVKIVRGKEVQD